MKVEYHKVALADEDVGGGVYLYAKGARKWELVALISIVVNAALVVMILTYISGSSTHPSFSESLRKLSSYSPLLTDITLSGHTTVVNGTLFPATSPPSIWRSPPSTDVDAAWEAISDTSIFAIAKSDVELLERDPSIVTQLPVSYGFGDNLYLAELDGQHHLHCLNMLRKYAYLPYYFPQHPNMSAMPSFHQTHLNHCVDILRQQLLCTFSTDVITYRWVKGQSIPQPDFSIRKVCKNRDQIERWLEKKWEDLPLSGDQKVNVPRPSNIAEIESESNPYWDDLVRKARAKGMSIHEYVQE